MIVLVDVMMDGDGEVMVMVMKVMKVLMTLILLYSYYLPLYRTL